MWRTLERVAKATSRLQNLIRNKIQFFFSLTFHVEDTLRAPSTQQGEYGDNSYQPFSKELYAKI